MTFREGKTVKEDNYCHVLMPLKFLLGTLNPHGMKNDGPTIVGGITTLLKL
jgi:hypothetical protein